MVHSGYLKGKIESLPIKNSKNVFTKKEKKREEGTTETSKRITRRNNKLTDCEKGKRETGRTEGNGKGGRRGR